MAGTNGEKRKAIVPKHLRKRAVRERKAAEAVADEARLEEARQRSEEAQRRAKEALAALAEAAQVEAARRKAAEDHEACARAARLEEAQQQEVEALARKEAADHEAGMRTAQLEEAQRQVVEALAREEAAREEEELLRRTMEDSEAHIWVNLESEAHAAQVLDNSIFDEDCMSCSDGSSDVWMEFSEFNDDPALISAREARWALEAEEAAERYNDAAPCDGERRSARGGCPRGTKSTSLWQSCVAFPEGIAKKLEMPSLSAALKYLCSCRQNCLRRARCSELDIYKQRCP